MAEKQEVQIPTGKSEAGKEIVKAVVTPSTEEATKKNKRSTKFC